MANWGWRAHNIAAEERHSQDRARAQKLDIIMDQVEALRNQPGKLSEALPKILQDLNELRGGFFPPRSVPADEVFVPPRPTELEG